MFWVSPSWLPLCCLVSYSLFKLIVVVWRTTAQSNFPLGTIMYILSYQINEQWHVYLKYNLIALVYLDIVPHPRKPECSVNKYCVHILVCKCVMDVWWFRASHSDQSELSHICDWQAESTTHTQPWNTLHQRFIWLTHLNTHTDQHMN